MNLSNAIRNRIKNLMEENNIQTINSVAKLAGISNSLHDLYKKSVALLYKIQYNQNSKIKKGCLL